MKDTTHITRNTITRRVVAILVTALLLGGINGFVAPPEAEAQSIGSKRTRFINYGREWRRWRNAGDSDSGGGSDSGGDSDSGGGFSADSDSGGGFATGGTGGGGTNTDIGGDDNGRGVPEMDLGSMGTAMTLMLGLAIIALDKRRTAPESNS